ncbi:MAG: aminodeoxychorismate/anthranilate synthase component II [Myxococcota bacterium]
MILVVDNYDSFTYNLVQYLLEIGAEVDVRRNDAVSVADVRALAPSGVLLGPGPGRPQDAGVTLDVLRDVDLPMLGVCLGHQCMVEAEGGRIVRAERLMHGRTSPMHHDGKGVFAGLPTPFNATRYHSLIAEDTSLPETFEKTAWTEEGELMGIRHRTRPWRGVQFHPESFLTEHGHRLLKNWIDAL